MKKKLLTATLTTIGMLSVFLLLFIACKKKEAPKAPTGVRSSVDISSILITWNDVENADYYVVTDEDGYAYYESGFQSGYYYADIFSYSDDALSEFGIRHSQWSDYQPIEGYNKYRVYAWNENGWSSSYGSTTCYYSGNGGGGGNSAPSAPTGVSATVSGSQIRISWNGVSNAEEYLVFWSEDGISFEYCIGITSNTYIYDYEDEEPFAENYYKVKARNGYGESPFSTSAYCHYSSGGGGGGGTTPDAPTNVTANVSGTSVRVSWSSVSNASYYRIYRSSTRSRSYSLIGTSTSTYYNDDSPVSDNYYKVTSVGSDGSESEMSSSAYCHYSSGGGGGTITPSVPSNVSASVTGTRVKVSWSYASNASSYRIYRSSSSYGTYSLLGTSSYNYYYDDDPLTNNYYKVTSVSSDGTESDKSSYAYCQYSGGGGGTTVPSAPTGVSAENTGSTLVPNVKITWNSVTGATSYKVYRSSTASGTYSQIGSATSNTYLYDGSPMQGKNYYKVKAVNSAGESAYSSYAMFNYTTTSVAPCPPSVTVTTSTSYATVKWTASTGFGCGTPTKYKVYKRNPHTGNMSLLTTSTSTSYKDNDVHPGINRYAVIAENSYGESGYQYGNSTSIALAKPSTFTAQKYQSTYIRCNWSKVTKATGYQISLSTSSSGTYVWEEIDNVNTTTKDIYYPANTGTTVYLKIRAIFRADYAGDPVYSDWTTYKTVTF